MKMAVHLNVNLIPSRSKSYETFVSHFSVELVLNGKNLFP